MERLEQENIQHSQPESNNEISRRRNKANRLFKYALCGAILTNAVGIAGIGYSDNEKWKVIGPKIEQLNPRPSHDEVQFADQTLNFYQKKCRVSFWNKTHYSTDGKIDQLTNCGATLFDIQRIEASTKVLGDEDKFLSKVDEEVKNNYVLNIIDEVSTPLAISGLLAAFITIAFKPAHASDGRDARKEEDIDII